MASDPPAEAPSSTAREKGKNRRRRAILDAAHDIIRRSGEAGITMRILAAEAGVSPATPYNLFGSKQAILQSIYDEDLAAFRDRFEGQFSDDALVRIFDLIDMSILFLEREPDFYRSLSGILHRNAGSEAASQAWAQRMEYLRGLIRDCIAARALRDDTPVELLSSTLSRLYKAVLQEWVDGTLSLEATRNEIGLGFDMLSGLVTPSGRSSLAQVRGRYPASPVILSLIG